MGKQYPLDQSLLTIQRLRCVLEWPFVTEFVAKDFVVTAYAGESVEDYKAEPGFELVALGVGFVFEKEFKRFVPLGEDRAGTGEVLFKAGL